MQKFSKNNRSKIRKPTIDKSYKPVYDVGKMTILKFDEEIKK